MHRPQLGGRFLRGNKNLVRALESPSVSELRATLSKPTCPPIVQSNHFSWKRFPIQSHPRLSLVTFLRVPHKRYDERCIPDIVATIKEGGYTNIRPPVALDVCSDPNTWPRPASEEGKLWDAIISINMIHIAPKECTTGLLAGAAAGLKKGGHLFIYGPFALNGLLEPDSNKAFHESLGARSRGQWGIRDAAWLADLADQFGLKLAAITLMPANNFFVALKKVRESGGISSSDEHAARVAEIVSTVIMPTREAFEKTLVAR